MSVEELFKLHAGAMVRVRVPHNWDGNDYVQFLGYHMGNVLMTRATGQALSSYRDDGYKVIPEAPAHTLAWATAPGHFNWDDVLGSVMDTDYRNFCCRCGKTYKNKQEHRKTCK